MTSRIEELITELQDYVDNCKPRQFKPDEIIVNKDEIDGLIEDLRHNVPQEIKQYQRIISNQEHIIADAHNKADKIINDAGVKRDELVSEHELFTQAYAKSNEVLILAGKDAERIVAEAEMQANEIRQNAMQYADSNLQIIQEIMTTSMETTKSKADNYMNQMQGYLDVITANRAELAPTIIALEAAARGESVPTLDEVPVETVNNTTEASQDTDVKIPDSVSSDNASDKSSATSGVDVPDVFFNKE